MAAGVQSIDRFVEDRRARWARLGDLVERAEGRVRRLTAREVLELGRLYRVATSDLAIGRRDFPRDAVTERLNDLVAAAHALVYAESPTSGGRLRRAITREVPATARAMLPFIGTSALLLFAPWLLAWLLGLAFPDVAAASMSDEMREHLVGRRTGTEIPADLRPVAGPLLFLNNARVAFTAFAGGMTAGILTVFVLVTNGVLLGTTIAVLQRYGGAEALLVFILAHGFLELSAIVLSGAAGLRLAWAILRPGERFRGDALRAAAGDATSLVLVVCGILVLAAILEAYVSPTLLPLPVKLATGVATGAALWTYLLRGFREAS